MKGVHQLSLSGKILGEIHGSSDCPNRKGTTRIPAGKLSLIVLADSPSLVGCGYLAK